jgi:hypothetical protein
MSQAFKPSGLSFRQRGILVNATAGIQAPAPSGSAAASQAVVLAAVASLERTSISGALGSWG